MKNRRNKNVTLDTEIKERFLKRNVFINVKKKKNLRN